MKKVSKHSLQVNQTCNCEEERVKPGYVLCKRQPSSPSLPSVER
jgi:hypothetical protein